MKKPEESRPKQFQLADFIMDPQLRKKVSRLSLRRRFELAAEFQRAHDQLYASAELMAGRIAYSNPRN